jgi:hypothetical protein
MFPSREVMWVGIASAARRGPAWATIFATLLFGSGCKSEHAFQGPRHDILASYNFRTLTCSVEREVRVPAVIAAAEVTLRQRGYSIKASRATEEFGEVTGEPFDANILESVVVKARQDKNLSTTIDVRVEPLGDQARSRSILDGILSNLGL